MTVSYAGTTFGVETQDGLLPYPTADAAGLVSYSATINVASLSDVENVRTKRSIVTTYPSLGFAEAGIVVVEGGPGASTLTIPIGTGDADYLAVLIAFEPQSLMMNDGYFRVAATWVIIDTLDL